MDYLPLHFDVRDRRCLLVGGGQIAIRKANLLLRAGARITVVAPDIDVQLEERLLGDRHQVVRREFRTEDLNDHVLVVSATSDSTVNQTVSKEAQTQGIPVNVVDNPNLCTVIFPAIVDRSPVVVSVSTGGQAPVLTSDIRRRIESLLPEGLVRLARYLGTRRNRLKTVFPDVDQRRRKTTEFLDSPGATAAMGGRDEEADNLLLTGDIIRTGEVYIVGAGPGDPDLLTLKALDLMQRCDVVLHDALIDDRVLDRLRRDAEIIYVGKKAGAPSTPQSVINDQLVNLAHAGKRVLRLKGGDPFIFGRGGEEMEALIDAAIPFEIVPGITAGSGCAAYAGIPLTHREYAQSVRFVTGHPKEGQVDLPWDEMVNDNQTIVFYMGLGGLSSICEQMIAHGRADTTPIALIAKGTTDKQRVLVGTLSDIVEKVRKTDVARPTLTIVGQVVTLASSEQNTHNVKRQGRISVR